MPDEASGVLTVRLGDTPGGAIAAEPGDTLLAALLRAGTGIRHICGGRCACGTCRIALEPDWTERLPAPSRNEARLLGVLAGASPAHRLACQITVDARTDGLVFRLDTPVNRRSASLDRTTAKGTHP